MALRARPPVRHVEAGGTWRPLWLVAGGLAVLVAVLAGRGVPLLLWVAAGVGVLGVVAASTVSARRLWTVRVDDGGLSVGRERIALVDVDLAHLRNVRAGAAGVDAGAPVLGGGWTVPRGRSALPLRLTDGRNVLVPTRNPAALSAALLAAAPATTPFGSSDEQGTLER